MNHFTAKKILVTGGAGFIGANFIHHLFKSSPEVTVINLDLLTYAANLAHLAPCETNPAYHFVQGNICDAALIHQLLTTYDIDTIVHFAAESHVDRSISGPGAFIQTNIVGTFTLLECARQVWSERWQLNPNHCRFHHISTDEVYGSLTETDPAFCETHRYDPSSPYSASKASSDHLVNAYFKTYGLPVTLSNCSNNYGPYQHPEKFIPTVINACRQQQPIPIYGNGQNIRDWLYVSDHCQAIDTIIRHGQVGHTYNVGANNEWHNLDIAHQICSIMDGINPQAEPHSRLIQFVTDRAGHDWRYAINSEKICHELNWQPQVTFTQGLQLTVASFI